MERTWKRRRKSESDKKDGKKATKVLIRIRIMDFLEEAWKSGMDTQTGISGNIYDKTELQKTILGILENYVSKMAAYSFFPIKVRCEKEKARQIKVGRNPGFGETGLKPKVIIEDAAGKQWTVRYQVTEEQVVLWLPQREFLVIYEEEKRKDLCYYKGILVSNEEQESSGGCSIRIIYFDKDVGKRLTVSRDRFHQQFRGQFAEDIRFCKALYARLLACNKEDIQKCKLSGNMAMNALVYYGLGMIEMKQDDYNALLKIHDSKIRVVRINKAGLAKLYGKTQEKIWEEFDALDRGMLYASLLESIMFEFDRVEAGSFLDILKERRTVLYSAEKGSSPERSTFHAFAQKLLEEKTEDKDLTYKDEGYILQRLREGDYIVMEREICKLLDWHGSKGGHVDIKEGSRYIMRIACAAVPGEVEEDRDSAKGNRIKDFMRDFMDRSEERL